MCPFWGKFHLSHMQTNHGIVFWWRNKSRPKWNSVVFNIKIIFLDKIHYRPRPAVNLFGQTELAKIWAEIRSAKLGRFWRFLRPKLHNIIPMGNKNKFLHIDLLCIEFFRPNTSAEAHALWAFKCWGWPGRWKQICRHLSVCRFCVIQIMQKLIVRGFMA